MRMVRVLTHMLLVLSLLWGATLAVAEKNPHAPQKTIRDAAGRTHVRSTRITPSQRQAVAKRMNVARAKAHKAQKATVQK